MPKLLYLAAIAAGLTSAAPAPEAVPSDYFIPISLVRQLKCDNGNGSGVTGTGSYIDRDLVLTAHHVTGNRSCSIDGTPVQVVYSNADLDISVVRTPDVSEARMTTSCTAPRAGEEYFAIGFANGRDFVVQRFTATGTAVPARSRDFHGMNVFRGASYHGMSGGPVIDRDGNIVGTLNAGNERSVMLSRSLSETYLCQR